MKRMMTWLAGWTDDLGVAEKIYGIAAGLMVVTTVLMAMSIQSARLQTGLRISATRAVTRPSTCSRSGSVR